MAKHEFKYYLHSESFWEHFEWTFKDTPLADLSDDETEELLQKIGRPFYEVTVDCVLDDETGDVEFTKFEGKKLIDLDEVQKLITEDRINNRDHWDVADVMAILRNA